MKLTLYEYRWPINSRDEKPIIAATQTCKHGSFDFGVLKSGHYSLIVEDQGWGSSDWVDVEIMRLPKETVSVTVDIAPNIPDCKGGHEFMVSAR